MLQSIKKLAVVLLLVAVFTSCNQGPTLQTYFVDNQTNNSFVSIDIPASLVKEDEIEKLTDEQKEAYKSVDKVNVLAFQRTDENIEKYNLELENVKVILEDPKYEELMRGSTSGGKFVLKFLGDSEESIDEFIIFGSASDKGFVVARVLGDDMNASKLMSLSSVLDSDQFENSQIKEWTEIFK